MCIRDRSSTQKFLQQVIEEHFNRLEGKGEISMGTARTVAVQVLSLIHILVSVNQMIGIMMGSIAVFGIIYYFVTLLPEGEGRR